MGSGSPLRERWGDCLVGEGSEKPHIFNTLKNSAHIKTVHPECVLERHGVAYGGRFAPYEGRGKVIGPASHPLIILSLPSHYPLINL